MIRPVASVEAPAHEAGPRDDSGRQKTARQYLERVLQESRTSGLTEIESEVIDLQQKWRGK